MRTAYPLRTDRLLLRRLVEEDIDVITEYRNDPKIAEFQDWELPVTRERVDRQVARMSTWTDIVPGEPCNIGIEYDGELIGDLYVGLDEHGGVAEIGFTLRAEYQGRGFAHEAAHALITDLIERLGCHRIFGQLSPKKSPIRRSARKTRHASRMPVSKVLLVPRRLGRQHGLRHERFRVARQKTDLACK